MGRLDGAEESMRCKVPSHESILIQKFHIQVASQLLAKPPLKTANAS
jgi:hypothetical protein